MRLVDFNLIKIKRERERGKGGYLFTCIDQTKFSIVWRRKRGG